MKVNVRLHGRLRDLLPPEARGRASVELDDGASLGDLLSELNVEPANLAISLNGHIVGEDERVLQPGDEVQMFAGIGGGTCAPVFERRRTRCPGSGAQ
jgi:sulfur carrier protein ThiS